MKTNQPTDAKIKISRVIEIARVRLSQAESTLASAKEQMRLARQRRKAAKQAARRAKKQFRLAKEQVAALQLSLENLETRRAELIKNSAEPKLIKASAKKPRTARRSISAAKRIKANPKSIVKKKAPATRRTKANRAARPDEESQQFVSAAASELESPLEMLPLAEHKPTPEIVEAVQEIFSKAPTITTESEPPTPEADILPAFTAPTSPAQTDL